MTTSLTSLTDLAAINPPSVPSPDPWVGLTEDDATRIAAALAATHAESTRKVYAFAWRRWVRWCSGRGIVPFPAKPAAVCAYLTQCAEQGFSLATIDSACSACSAIGHQHRSHGVPDPIDPDAVRQVRRGLRRLIGRAPRRPTRPLSVTDLRQIVTAIDRTTVRGVRDTALILVGFAGALRRSELAALTLADLEAKPSGLLLHLRRSKTDQEARGQFVGIAHGHYALTDPIAALDAWLALRGTRPGPVFTSLRPGTRSLQPISGNAVSTLVKERAQAAGLSAAGSAATRSVPGMPPAPPRRASASTGSPPRPGTAASTSSSSTTSARSRHCRRLPAATSDSDLPPQRHREPAPHLSPQARRLCPEPDLQVATAFGGANGCRCTGTILRPSRTLRSTVG